MPRRDRKGVRRGLAILCLLLACVAARAQEGPTEYEVKAAFLYNFSKFVDWPPEAASDTFAICVLGEDPFGPVLDRMVAGKAVRGKKLVARRTERVEDAAECQIVFVSASEGSRLAQILAALRGRSVLTVGESRDFAQRGGVMNFQVEESKVRFEINLDAAQRSRLTVSSQLLKLAKVIGKSS